ncbi:F-actin-monooxygenase MICAL3 isoform X12 [Myiozetetes cayanensis]|uniref:F-actin-monooxygenase MICAL3 isoform X12 n=1 Tax=Myiozetetes cayanensis TaxID=478635 RepID=UPI00215EC012|nr:F-actin-monooxygenase MICAL3 isoform X12 [Myiozetetes cayanensis]
MEESKNEKVNQAHVLFDRFVQASTCKGTLKAFQELCDYLELKPKDYRSFYHKLKSKLNYWKAKALWAKLDKRGSHKDYKKGKACANTKCLIIGAGPCGLRTAIDLSFLGAKVVVIEKRDAFSRNNVLHLWPFTIHDLRGLGAKKFYGKFCAGSIDHISIRQLQLILLKVALILGIEIHVNVEFRGLVYPPEDQENERIGWRALVHPKTHPVSEYEFEVIIGGDGRRNTLEGFRRKEFRGKLAIAITANFINRNTTAEAKVEEISGVAFIFNQKFFQDLREATGIDLENIVYYKDDTHYFVMTAKKQSLLDKGVIRHDHADTEVLLSRENVDQEALLNYAREAADFSTNQQLPSLDFAINHYGQPDVAMFDFTCMYASENAALVREQNGHQLLVALVGDSLLEPFWPMGTGIARGFLAAMDSAWMVRSWSLGASPLEVLAERESIYRLLPQTTPENVSKNFSHYSIDPATRYPNINVNFLRPQQVRHLYNTGDLKDIHLEIENFVNSRTPKLTRNESVARSSKLLSWCQRQTDGYAGVNVTDLTMSWKSGLALCAIIHRYRPDLIDFDSLDEHDVEKNNQLAFDIAEKEFGISPIMTGKEMASVGEPDKLSMVMYLTQFYEMFKDTIPSSDSLDLNAEEKAALIASTKSPISFLSKLGQSISRKRTPKDKKEKELDGAGKRRKTSQSEDEDLPRSYREERPTLVSALTERRIDAAIGNQNKVKSMATQLLAKFEENAPVPSSSLRRQQPVLPYQERVHNQPSSRREQGRLAPIPQWKQKYIKMYTGGVSSLAEQIANQLQRKEQPKTLLDKKELGSLKKEFPQNLGGSDVCYFCRKRVYVMERLSAEGKFFHRSCFKCEYCATTLRLSSYAYDIEDGKFYCKPHYCYRLSGYAQRKRPAVGPLSGKDNKGPLQDAMASDGNGRANAIPASAERAPGSNVNGLEEPSLAKRLRGTPERIELENYRLSLQREEELEEVPEETLAEHNLSSVLDKGTEEDVPSSSSESEMEEEDEEEEDELLLPQQPPSDLGGVPWKEAVRIHALLKGKSEEEIEAEVNHEIEDKDDYDEEEYEEEEDEESSEASDLPSVRHEAVQAWLETVPGDDIASDAEAEFRLRQGGVEQPALKVSEDEEDEEEAEAASCSVAEDPCKPSIPIQAPSDSVLPLSPAASPKAKQAEDVRDPLAEVHRAIKSPEARFFPEPFVLEEGPKDEIPKERRVKSPLVPPSPVLSQPVASPEAVAPTSLAECQPAATTLASSPKSAQMPICSQPLPSAETSIPSPVEPPVCFQPVPALTSTPLAKLVLRGQDGEVEKLGSPTTAEEALKRSSLVEEFWMKSAEIRRSLGLTPVERNKRPETNFTVSALETTPLKSFNSKNISGDERIHPVKPQPAPRRQGLSKLENEQISLLTPKSPSEKELKISGEVRGDVSSSSGLGLQESSSNMRTMASQSFNTSDSTMLTPPSSPPPPPPQNEEPATLRRKRYQALWHNEVEARSPPTPASTPPVLRHREPAPAARETTPAKREDVRKSFAESVDEIPFADDVEDTYDDRTEDSSLHEKFFTPPTSRPRPEKPLVLPLVKENGGPPSMEGGVNQKKRLFPEISVEAKELAEERMRAREKSVKSQALRDAMAKQLCKMKDMEMAAAAATAATRARKASSMPLKTKELFYESPKHLALRLAEGSTRKHNSTSEKFSTPPADMAGPEGSVSSSEGSSGKSKKRSSLFSPRKNKKEKKSKNDSRLSDKSSGGTEEATKPRSLWKSVFSGYKKDKKKKTDDKSCPSTPSSSATVDSGKHKASPLITAADLQLRQHLSFSEDSDLSSDDVLERSSQKSKRESIYVPHALAFKRSYSSKRAYTEEELNAKLTRRVQKAARRQAKQEELKRLHRAQIIQRQLEQVEEKQRQLEERGVAVEKALRGEAVEPNAGTPRRRPLSFCPCCAHEGMGKKDDPKLMQEWFKLVQEKNALVRYESELMIFARELELEDRQSRLQQELRERMAVEDHLKTDEELSEEKRILNEMLEVVEQRDSLVALLEEQRLREKEEDKDLEAVMLSKGFSLNWS